MKYSSEYREEVTLAGGRAVELRLVRPEDKELLARGLRRQSAESRYRRFFTDKESLSDEELKYLTELDGENHFAIGAVEGEEGRGIARFVRLKDRPDTAEWAIAVDDEIHGQGLGRILFARLCEAARERNVARLRCEVLAFNEPMRNLVAGLAPDALVEDQGLVVGLEFPLPPANSDESPQKENPLYRIMRYAAEGVLSVGRALASLTE